MPGKRRSVLTTISSSATITGAFQDLVEGLKRLKLAAWLANADLEARYHRTSIGSLWSILSHIFWIASLGFTFSALFKQDIRTFVPYLALGLTFWVYLSNSLVEAPSVFSRNVGLISSYRLPLSLQILRSVITQLFQLGQYLLVMVPAVMILGVQLTPVAFLSILALPVYAVFSVSLALLLGPLGTRWRDVQQFVPNIVTLLFLITPIFWQKELIKDHAWLYEWNPFFHMIEIARAPLLGAPASMSSWIFSVGFCVVALVGGTLVFSRTRTRIYYWI